ncbi:MAG: hypothetical protein DBX46_05105, partial [Clostridiales bacterium]
ACIRPFHRSGRDCVVAEGMRDGRQTVGFGLYGLHSPIPLLQRAGAVTENIQDGERHLSA